MSGEIIQTQVCSYLEATGVVPRQEWRLQVPEGEREVEESRASEEQWGRMGLEGSGDKSV